jgi:predicted flavoprotein YhiN
MATCKPKSVSEACDSKQAARLIDAVRKDLNDLGRNHYQTLDIKSLSSVQAILGLSQDQQVPVVLEAIARQTESMRKLGSHEDEHEVASTTTTALLDLYLGMQQGSSARLI